MINITIFFRSNEASNRYVSATKAKLDSIMDGKLANLHYENLDKRKFENYFKKHKTPDYVFVWHDEEILIEFIETNYPSVIIETMSGEDRVYNTNVYYGNPNSFIIYDRIKDIIEKSIPTITYYRIHNFEIQECKSKQNNISGEYYLDKKDAKHVLKETINRKIEYLNTELKKYEDKLTKI